MRVCSICGNKIHSEDIFLEYEFDQSKYDESAFGESECFEKSLCKECEHEVYVYETTEIDTMDIDDFDLGISYFDDLDLRTQRDYIMDSVGSTEEKLLMINKYIENGYYELGEFSKEERNYE